MKYQLDDNIRGCTRLALNSTPIPQDFKLPGRCAEVKPKFAFFQEQQEKFEINSGCIFARRVLPDSKNSQCR